MSLVATRPFRVLDLRNEQKLDLLDLDDRISTSHEPKVWEAAHLLAQRAHGWWDRIDGIVYRARTTPSSTSNLAIWSIDGCTDGGAAAARLHRGARRPRPPPRLHGRLRLGLRLRSPMIGQTRVRLLSDRL